MIDLDGKVGQVAVGGGGRYIVMHQPDKGQLVLFDASTAKTTVTAADTGDVRLAAGLSRLVLYAPNGNMLRVYSLPGLTKVFETTSPMDNFKSIAMGSRTDGPLLGSGTFGDLILLDINADGVKEVEGSRGKPGHHWDNIRATPDGTAFATFSRLGNNDKVKLLTEANRKWKVTDLPLVPFVGADGNFYGHGTAVNRTGQQVSVGGVGAGSGVWYVPAVSGNTGMFVKLAVTTTGVGAKNKKVTLTVHANRNADVPAFGTTALTGIPEFETLVDIRINSITIPWDRILDHHLFLIPDAKLLVTLSANKDKLYLRKLGL